MLVVTLELKLESIICFSILASGVANIKVTCILVYKGPKKCILPHFPLNPDLEIGPVLPYEQAGL